MHQNILLPCRYYRRRDLFILSLSVRPLQITIWIPRENRLCSPRLLVHCRFHVPNCHPVSQRQVTSDDVPAPLPRSQLACGEVRAELEYRLDGKVGGVPVKQRNAAAVSARRRRRNDPVPGRYSGVDSFHQICLLKHPYFYIGLTHPS